MSLRDRMIQAAAGGNHDAGYYHDHPGLMQIAEVSVDAILAACPEISALNHAREGWLHEDPERWVVVPWQTDGVNRRVLVIDAPEAES